MHAYKCTTALQCVQDIVLTYSTQLPLLLQQSGHGCQRVHCTVPTSVPAGEVFAVSRCAKLVTFLRWLVAHGLQQEFFHFSRLVVKSTLQFSNQNDQKSSTAQVKPLIFSISAAIHRLSFQTSEIQCMVRFFTSPAYNYSPFTGSDILHKQRPILSSG